MVPRVRILGIQVGMPPRSHPRAPCGSDAHALPVYEKDLDHIVGMVHIKDLLRLLVHEDHHRRARPRVPVVPETAELDTVLTVMRQRSRRWPW